MKINILKKQSFKNELISNDYKKYKKFSYKKKLI